MVVGTIEWYKTSQTFNLVIYDERIASCKSLVQFNQITYRAMRSRCVGYPTFNWNSCIYKTLRYTIFEIIFEKENNHCQRCIPTKLQLPPATWRPKEKRYNDTEQNQFFPFHRVKMMGGICDVISLRREKITMCRQLAALTILLLCLIGEDRFQSFASLRKKFPLILCFSVVFRL